MNKRKGISLIVLIITIVVIIILATAIIMSLGNTRIIDNAEKATIEQRAVNVEESKHLWEIETEMEKALKKEISKDLNTFLDELENQKLITSEERKTIEDTGKVTIGSKPITFFEKDESPEIGGDETPDIEDDVVTEVIEPTTLVSCDREFSSTSGFLGNTNIKREEIENVTITTSLEGHVANETDCWDVSANQSGTYLAWYEDKDSDGYYEVTIGGKVPVVANEDSSYLFSNIGYNGNGDNIAIEGLDNLDTSNVYDMTYMFNDCSKLTSLDLSSFDTSNVYDMSEMFYNCSGLTSLDLGSFNTSNVYDMFGMFCDCSDLTSLDVSSFNTSNVTDMCEMFYNCSGLTSLNLNNFNTSNVNNMSDMFCNCSRLTSLDLSGFNTSNVKYMSNMFKSCSSLTNLNLSSFDTSSVTDMDSMFCDCSFLTSLDISNFDISNVMDFSEMFNMMNMFLAQIKSTTAVKDWLTTNFADIMSQVTFETI